MTCNDEDDGNGLDDVKANVSFLIHNLFLIVR